jgi:alpha-maltose-1-phosphate synthase
MSVAIYYHPEAYSTESPKLMGRNAAGDSFIRGYLKHSKSTNTFYLQATSQAHVDHFAARARVFNRREQIKAFSKQNLFKAEHAGTIYYPGPDIGKAAYHRRLFGDDKWSLCGITHTTSSTSAMDSIASLITSPVQPWDGLICTSTSVRDNVQVILQAEANAMQQRLGATKLVLPEIPVIPLGIHTEDFEYSADQRTAARKYLDVSDNTLVVLYMGRLSFHAKAHPLAMYQSLQQASEVTKKEVLLVECGWYANDNIKDAFADAAKMVAPNVRVVTLDGREEQNREIAWAGADVFCSLSDNIQETFGITPLEAMAAGLPVVVTDWDGYRDTVRHEVDGFRVPTLAPAPGLLSDLAQRHALDIDTYDMYCCLNSSLVAVNSIALTNAFTALFNSPELRKKMGDAGRARAREDYDWKTIIARYEQFWFGLNEKRIRTKVNKDEASESRKSRSVSNIPAASQWPARLDPSVGFSSYPTRQLNGDTLLQLSVDASESAILLAKLKTLTMVNCAEIIFPTDSEINQVLDAASMSPQKASTIISKIEESRKPLLLRSLAWLCKLGVLTFS